MDTLMKPKILIVEDREREQKAYGQALGERVEILAAYSIEEAEKLFAENPDIKLIVMDACVPGDRPNTMSLVKKFRETFFGPMIAASSMEAYRQMLMDAGCDHQCTKPFVPYTVVSLLPSIQEEMAKKPIAIPTDVAIYLMNDLPPPPQAKISYHELVLAFCHLGVRVDGTLPGSSEAAVEIADNIRKMGAILRQQNPDLCEKMPKFDRYKTDTLERGKQIKLWMNDYAGIYGHEIILGATEEHRNVADGGAPESRIATSGGGLEGRVDLSKAIPLKEAIMLMNGYLALDVKSGQFDQVLRAMRNLPEFEEAYNEAAQSKTKRCNELKDAQAFRRLYAHEQEELEESTYYLNSLTKSPMHKREYGPIADVMGETLKKLAPKLYEAAPKDADYQQSKAVVELNDTDHPTAIDAILAFKQAEHTSAKENSKSYLAAVEEFVAGAGKVFGDAVSLEGGKGRVS